MKTMIQQAEAEWLETDGLGGFASGTVSGIRRRRYHALLLCSTTPPTGRVVLVNGFEAWIETPSGRYDLSSQQYHPDVVHPRGFQSLQSFSTVPWPTWVYEFEDGTKIEASLFIPYEQAAVVLTWKLLTPRPMTSLFVRPLLSGRGYHSLHHENLSFQFNASQRGEAVVWRPYADLPAVVSQSNGHYEHSPVWYRNFLYEEEKNRGLDHLEDLASPGIIQWNLSQQEAVWVLGASGVPGALSESTQSVFQFAQSTKKQELLRRSLFATRLDRAADAYVARRQKGKTIVAGYPWFTDWGRDTFIAIRGLCLTTGRLSVARDILVEWAGVVSNGMLPNLFPDQGMIPEYNSVDASLWYVIAVYEFLELADSKLLSTAQRQQLLTAINSILTGYSQGTRFGIQADTDGLLKAGIDGVQLTWMDAKVGDWVVTPRRGKPVEVQALWINALHIGSTFFPKWQAAYQQAFDSFQKRFWNAEKEMLYDVIDVNGFAGKMDDTCRPNQIFAVGGLPFPILNGQRAQRVLQVVEEKLWTPMGLRSLSPDEPGYSPRYQGGVLERDGAYHQGTVWPWLMGAFVEAWLRARGNNLKTRQQAHKKFLQPLINHLDAAGLDHVSEIADAEAPFTPRGCPFQAWSVGELIRIVKILERQTRTHVVGRRRRILK